MLRRLLFLFSLLFLPAVLQGGSHPNIVLILVDDMGYGDLGSYNPDSKIPTPHIDSIAREGLRFTNAHSAGSLCHPSRYGLMTGQLPFRIDYTVWPKQPVIAPERTTVASLLKGENYRTAMVGKWHLGFEEQGYDQRLAGGPIDRGFDTFLGMRASTDIPPYFYIDGDRALVPPYNSIPANYSDGWTKIQGAFWRQGGIAPNLQLEDVLPRFTDEAVGVIRNHARLAAEDPLFLYLAYPAPHTPWLPSPEFQGKSGASMYGDFVMMVDHMVGRVLAALDDVGMTEETLVIFSSDNGPVWYPADVEKHGHDAVAGLKGMKGDAYEGGHRMPFIVRWPGQVAPGGSTDQLICFTDVLATLADITGHTLESDEGPDSISFLPALMGSPQAGETARDSLILESAQGLFSVRSGKWKYINGVGSGGFSGRGSRQHYNMDPGTGGFADQSKKETVVGQPRQQLYDLEADPGETTNLILQYPEVARQLELSLQEALAEGYWKS